MLAKDVKKDWKLYTKTKSDSAPAKKPAGDPTARAMEDRDKKIARLRLKKELEMKIQVSLFSL